MSKQQDRMLTEIDSNWKQHLEIGQNVLYENRHQDLSKSQKLQQRRLGPFTVTERVTKTTYQTQDNKDPTILKTIHRNHLVEYYPKKEILPPMIEEYVPMDRRYCILRLKQGKKRCIIALLDPLIILICVNSFPRKSIFLATSFVETKISLSR